MFEVGSYVRCVFDGYGTFNKGNIYQIVAIPGYRTLVNEAGKRVNMLMSPYFEQVVEPFAYRVTGPATSKGKRKVNKYEQAVLSFLACNPDGTGKEIASGMREPLNCITPRFAPLRRKGLIKDSGIKRDKQIVWVLA